MAPKKANTLFEAEVAAMIARQLQAVIPTIVAQVTTGIRANNTVNEPTSTTTATANTPPPDTNVAPGVTTPLNTDNVINTNNTHPTVNVIGNPETILNTDNVTNPNPVSVINTTANNNTHPNTGNDRNNPEPPRQDYVYKQFKSCNPTEFRGIEGPNGLIKWIEKTEFVINISECPPDRIVKYATTMFLDHALMWWNTVVQLRGQDAINRMSWTELKTLVLKQFCPRDEILKLEHELWNLEMRGADHLSYTNCFNELTRLVPWSIIPESKSIKRYIWGLTPAVRSIVNSAVHPTLESTVSQASVVTFDLTRNGVLRVAIESSSLKRTSYTSRTQVKSQNKRICPTTQDYAMTSFDMKHDTYKGSFPKCGNIGHCAPSGRTIMNTSNRQFQTTQPRRSQTPSPQPIRQQSNQQTPSTMNPHTCYKCGSRKHFRRHCPKLNPDVVKGLNQGQTSTSHPARGRTFVNGSDETQQDSHVVTCTCLVSNH
ncbi:uncharacterized protein LOC143635592 [Bidens hawaiensis]|uniref:uncharacterized protein LOC143635592 n=1 Tax=Bidens hawaiensis TaxID=980011 RepID=UPI00404B24F8